MGQLRFIDEDDFPANLELAKIYLKEFVNLENKLSELRKIMYPENDFWISSGTVIDMNKMFLDQAIADGRKYKQKKRIFKKK